MSKSRTETWARADRPGRRPAARGDSGALGVYERHCDAAAPEPAGRAIRDAFGPVAKVGRRRGAGAADRPCRSHRAEPARALGGGRCRWRHRVGRRLWLGGSREPGARRARYAVQDRHRLHGAHLGRRRPAAGERPAEARRQDSDVRACVPGETVARDTAPVDGASGRRQDRRRRRGAAVVGALRAAGRRAAVLSRRVRCCSSRGPSSAIRATAGSW